MRTALMLTLGLIACSGPVHANLLTPSDWRFQCRFDKLHMRAADPSLSGRGDTLGFQIGQFDRFRKGEATIFGDTGASEVSYQRMGESFVFQRVYDESPGSGQLITISPEPNGEPFYIGALSTHKLYKLGFTISQWAGYCVRELD